MDDDGLRSKARTAIASGTLPADVQNRMWGGSGTRATCVVCGLPINREDVEVDVECYRDGGAPHTSDVRVGDGATPAHESSHCRRRATAGGAW
jgi:hypothetical protein